MDCKKVQEFLITDYIDGRLEDKQKRLIDQHLAYCQPCENFLLNIKNEAVNPLINAQRVVPAECLWAHIKESIELKEQSLIEESLTPGFWEKLKSAVHIPRPAFALGLFVTMIFMFGTTGQLLMPRPLVTMNGQTQVQYLSSLIEEPVDITGNNGNDQQTPIEKYFL